MDSPPRIYNRRQETFSANYRCYSVVMMSGSERPDIEAGGRIVLPQSALEELMHLDVQYPMMFKITNSQGGRVTHCGVIEFVAEEGRAYLPYWMMDNLQLDEGAIVQIENISLELATLVKFQAQSVDFLDIEDHKSVLESALRSFSCLTRGDMISIYYNEKRYDLEVLETEPNEAVSIIECDLNVDFAAPVGYQEPKRVNNDIFDYDNTPDLSGPQYAEKGFRAFGGQGMRLDGKASKDNNTDDKPRRRRGIPNYNYYINRRTIFNNRGGLFFIHNFKNEIIDEQKNGEKIEDKKNSKFQPFSGNGMSLR